jgi:hypothetical protein
MKCSIAFVALSLALKIIICSSLFLFNWLGAVVVAIVESNQFVEDESNEGDKGIIMCCGRKMVPDLLKVIWFTKHRWKSDLGEFNAKVAKHIM